MKLRKLLFVVLSLFSLNSYGQELIKVGPSFLSNRFYDTSKVVSMIGFEVAAETEISMKSGAYFALNWHKGTFKDSFQNDEHEVLSRSLALHLEYRFHLMERYSGVYLGLGGDYRFNWFKSENIPAYDDLYLNFGVGFSGGYFFNINDKHYINPNIYYGVDPIGISENYDRNIRFSITYGF